MRNRKSISPSVRLGGAARAVTPRSLAVCCVLLVGALSGCGSVQTTTTGGVGSSPEGFASPQPPVIAGIPPTSARVGIPYDYTPTVSDALSSALTFDIANMPAWASFNTATGELKGTPSAGDVGTSGAIEIGVSDGIGRSTVGPFRITVARSPHLPTAPPTISGMPPTSAVAGQMYLFAPSASDSTGNPLTFLIVNRPSWASFNTSTGELSGKPAPANVGSYPNVVIGVSNGTTTTLLPAFTVTVSAAPMDIPTISGSPATTVNTGSAYSFTPTASDPAGRALSFAIQNQPAWASFDTHTGQLSGTPTAADIGSYPNIGISVSDATSAASLPVFTITVSQAPVDGPPTISGRAATAATAGAAYSFIPSASDPAGRALTFSIQNQPAWLSFDMSTGRISGTPTAADVGSFPGIAISVSDGTQSASLPPFAITVSIPVDGTPTITGAPATSVVVGSTYSFTPSATDPDGHPLTFSIQNRPAWAGFNVGTGELSGTPAAADMGGYTNIAISVTNGTSSASLPAFSIAVTQGSSGTVTVTWSIPTRNTNGTPLVGLAGFRVFYGTDPNNLTQSELVPDPGATSHVLANLAPGTWFIGLEDYTNSGAASGLSNIGKATVQ